MTCAQSYQWDQSRWVRGQGFAQAVASRHKVVAVDLVQISEVHSGRGYQSHYGMRLHFGLGTHARVDRIEVRWIGGPVDVIENIHADQCVTLVEGGVEP